MTKDKGVNEYAMSFARSQVLRFTCHRLLILKFECH